MMSEPKNDPAQMFQQIMQQLTQSDAGVKDDGLGVDGFSTETVRPMESLDDGGIIPLHGVTVDYLF
jgi:hypothetical protein